MVEKRIYFYIGGIVSLIFYLGMLFSFIFLSLNSDKKHITYTSKKKELFFEVNIVTLPKTKSPDQVQVKQPQKKPEEKKAPEALAKKEDVPVQATTHKDLNSLFSKVDTKKIKRVKRAVKKVVVKDPFKDLNLEKLASRLKIKENKASKKADKLMKKFMALQKTATVSHKAGKYDKFFGKIQEILDSNWQLTYDTSSGNTAEVKIEIDSNGKMRYTILTHSYDTIFNKKLEDFLLQMLRMEFPPYEGTGFASMIVNFKDE